MTIESLVGDLPEGAAHEIFMFPQCHEGAYSPLPVGTLGVQGWWLAGDCYYLGTCSQRLSHSQLFTSAQPDPSGTEPQGLRPFRCSSPVVLREPTDDYESVWV